MASTPANGPTNPTPSVPASGDWPAQAADMVVGTVDAVRTRTTGTILTIARVTVFGLLVVLLGLVVLVMTIVLLIRFLDAILPSSVWRPTSSSDSPASSVDSSCSAAVIRSGIRSTPDGFTSPHDRWIPPPVSLPTGSPHV